MKREAGDYIADIIDAIDKANKFIGNMSEEIPPLKFEFEKMLKGL